MSGGNIEAALIGGAVIMFMGLLGQAVRYGSLKQEVAEMKGDIVELKQAFNNLQNLIVRLLPGRKSEL